MRTLSIISIFLLASSLIIVPSQFSESSSSSVPFYISLVIHIHQPIYDASRNICQLVSIGSNNVYKVFRDRSVIYTYYLLDLIDYIENNNLPVSITIDITGTLIENLENLTSCASSISGLENYTYVWSNWSSRAYTRVEFTSTLYHYTLTPVLTRISDQDSAYLLFRYGVDKHNATLQSFTNKKPGYMDIVGYYPPEIALDNNALDLIAWGGFNYIFVDDIHIYRIYPDYSTPRRVPDTWYTNDEVEENADQLYVVNDIPGNWIYLSFNTGGTDYYHVMNPYIGLRPHYVETNHGPLIIFPRNRFFSVLMHSIMYFNNDDINKARDQFLGFINYLQTYNTDPERPFILTMVFDGDNGDPYTHSNTWWIFIKNLIANVTTPGSPYSYVKFVSPAWYLKHVYNPVNDNNWHYAKLPFIEPGSWNTDTTWGDPYLTKWIYPSKFSNQQKMLNSLTKALAYYMNARTYSPSDPRLSKILNWISIATQSDWLYYPTGDFLNNFSYATYQAIATANQITTNDYSPPLFMFGWFECPENNYKPGLIYWNTHPWIKVHVWDTSNVNSVILKAIVGEHTYTYTMSQEPDFQGNYYAQITDDLQPGSTLLLNISAGDSAGRESYIVIQLAKVVDMVFKLDGVVDTDARVLWINTTNNVLQTLYANDTTNYIYIAFNTTKTGSGYDTFLFIVSDTSKGRISHPWNKKGYVPMYDYYIGMEESNGWSGLWIRMNGVNGVKDVLIGASWVIRYVWDSVKGLCEAIVARDIYRQSYSTDRLFLGIASWGTADNSNVYEKLRRVSMYNTLYSDELISIYLDQPYLKTYFTPDQGLSALDSIISAIKSARSYVYIAMYNWQNQTRDSKIWDIAREIVNAKNRGVWIAVVVDGDHSNTDPLNYLRSNGIGVTVESGNGIMHNKFIVIDGVIVFTGSANLVDSDYTWVGNEYMYNDVLEIHSTWFAKPYELEFIEMKYHSTFHGGEPTPAQIYTQKILLNNTWVDVEFYFPPDDGSALENRWISLLGSSNKAYVMAYVLTLDNIRNALVNIYNSGGDVKVLLDYSQRSTTGSEYVSLLSNNVPTALNYDDQILSGVQLLHHKVFIIAGSIVSTGSTNPTVSGLTINDENTVIIHWSDLGRIYEYRFKTIWNKYVAHINVKVYEGDRVKQNAFVNITAYDLGGLTNNNIQTYSYTGYTNSSGWLSVEAYLWNPNPTARFTVNASTSRGWNTTSIYLGLDNNTVSITMWITIYDKPGLSISGPTSVRVGSPATYTIIITFSNGTKVDRDVVLDISINDTYFGRITLTRGSGSWSYTPQQEGTYNITFKYSGGDWINGIQLLSTSSYVLLNAQTGVLETQLAVSGPSQAYYGQVVQYSIELRDNNGNRINVNTVVKIYVNNNYVGEASLTNGAGSWRFEYQSAGSYNMLFLYEGGDVYNGYVLSSSSKSIALTINEALTSVSITAPSAVGVGESFTITVRLLNNVNNQPIANALIEIYINNTVYTTGYTGGDGVFTTMYTASTPGQLLLNARYGGESGRYKASSASKTINVIPPIQTKLVIIGPSTAYIGDVVKYRFELRYLGNNTIIPINTNIIVYLNNTMQIYPLSQGVYEIQLTINRLGPYNVTAVYGGGRFGSTMLLSSKTTLITNLVKRNVEIKALAKYYWINETHINLYLDIEVIDKINNQYVRTGYIEIYLNKSSRYELILRRNITGNKISIQGVYDPITPSIKIIYIDPSGRYQSGESEGACIEITSPIPIQPGPEYPNMTALLLIMIILYFIYRRGKNLN